MYRVYWGPDLLDQLSAAYNQADHNGREAILVAVERIDAALLADPMATGESRDSDELRIVVERPLAVTFRVDVANRLVRVTSVSIFERSS